MWGSRFRIHHRVADAYRAGRLLLAGDAAHVHSPAGGQGMNTGIQDGYALGRALVEDRIDMYEARQRPVALRVGAFTDRTTRIGTLRDAPARAVWNAMLPLVSRVPAVRRRLATELAELNCRWLGASWEPTRPRPGDDPTSPSCPSRRALETSTARQAVHYRTVTTPSRIVH